MIEQYLNENFARLYRQGLVAAGDPARRRIFRSKLERKLPIVYGAIGGSITRGAKATDCFGYSDRLARKFRERTFCRFVNAGIGATGSRFGAFRAAEDLLQFRPDVITVEFAVNDHEGESAEETYEGLLRQIMVQEQFPLVVLIFTMDQKGKNLQHVHAAAGAHYGLPMLSYRDALWPEIEAGRFTWRDISPDEVHPNDAGHDFIADMVAHFIFDEPIPPPELPAPLTPGSLDYDRGSSLAPEAWKIVRNTGWSLFSAPGEPDSMAAAEPGAELEIEIEAKHLELGFAKYAGDFGMADVWLDGKKMTTLDGFFVLADPVHAVWRGNHTVTVPLLRERETRRHVLKFVLSDARHEGSAGHLFKLRRLLVN